MSINRLRHLTAFAATDAPADGDNGGGETFDVEIPEDLTALDDAALTGLHARAVEAFRAVYGDGADVTDEALATLSDLADGIEALNAETASRQAAAAERKLRWSATATRYSRSLRFMPGG